MDRAKLNDSISEIESIFDSWKDYNLPVFYSTCTIKKIGDDVQLEKFVSVDFYHTTKYSVSASHKPITKLIKNE